MPRKSGSSSGMGIELAHRWANAFGSQPMMTQEIIGPKNPFPEYGTVQAIQRTMESAGFTLEVRNYDEKRKLYSLAPHVVNQLQSEEQ